MVLSNFSVNMLSPLAQTLIKEQSSLSLGVITENTREENSTSKGSWILDSGVPSADGITL